MRVKDRDQWFQVLQTEVCFGEFQEKMSGIESRLSGDGLG